MTMLRPKLSQMARAARRIKQEPLPSAAADAGALRRQQPTHFRLVESPGCRRVVLTGADGVLDGKAAESLYWKLKAWENNYLVKGILIRGRGAGADAGVFSAGWDRAAADAPRAFRRYSQAAYLLATLTKPTIAHLNGEVRGGGMGLGLARFRVATEKSSFHVPAAKEGWVLDGGLSYLLPRVLRPTADATARGGPEALAFARYLALTGAALSGRDMLALGLATHYMADNSAVYLPRQLADLTYEPDHRVEEAVAECAEAYYKLDTLTNPSPYRGLASQWGRNDERRLRMVAMAANQGGGDRGPLNRAERLYDEMGQEDADSAELPEEEEGAQGPPMFQLEMEEGDGEALKQQQARGPQSRSQLEDSLLDEDEERFEIGGKVVDTGVNTDGLIIRHGLMEEAEEADRAAALAAPSDAKGSLWWHRNFAGPDEALVRAQEEVVYEALAGGVLRNERTVEMVAAAAKFADGFFPEYVSYPERSRLVDPDRLLLTPWDSSLDRAEAFPELLELSERVQRCFKGESLEEVVAALYGDGSPWAEECLRRMDEASPLSLKLAFKQLDECAGQVIEESFKMEARLGHRLLKQQQQRAASKKGNALNRLAEVSAAQVEEMALKPLEGTEGEEDGELLLPERVVDDIRGKDPSIERRYRRVSTTKGSN